MLEGENLLNPSSFIMWVWRCEISSALKRFTKSFWCGQRLSWVGWKVGRQWKMRVFRCWFHLMLPRLLCRRQQEPICSGSKAKKAAAEWLSRHGHLAQAASCCPRHYPLGTELASDWDLGFATGNILSISRQIEGDNSNTLGLKNTYCVRTTN